MTIEEPPRIAVYDMIAAAKGRDNKYASSLYKRYLEEGKVPACEEVKPVLISSRVGNQVFEHDGGNRKKVRVATAREMVKIMWALPGETAFKQICAVVIVRYLRGDTSLVADVLANRAVQEQMADESPDHPMRIFGEEVQARGAKRGFEEAIGAVVEQGIDRGLGRFADAIEKSIQSGIERVTRADREAVASVVKELHAWDFSRPGRDKRLEDLGARVEGAALERLEEDEGVVRSSDYLQARFPEDVWRVFKNTFHNFLRRRLREARVADAKKMKRPVYTCRNQGGDTYRLHPERHRPHGRGLSAVRGQLQAHREKGHGKTGADHRLRAAAGDRVARGRRRLVLTRAARARRGEEQHP